MSGSEILESAHSTLVESAELASIGSPAPAEFSPLQRLKSSYIVLVTVWWFQ